MLRRAIDGASGTINQAGDVSQSQKTRQFVLKLLRLSGTCCGGLVVEMVLIAGSRGVDAIIALELLPRLVHRGSHVL